MQIVQLSFLNCFLYVTLLSNRFLTFGKNFETFVCQTGIQRKHYFGLLSILKYQKTSEKYSMKQKKHYSYFYKKKNCKL